MDEFFASILLLDPPALLAVHVGLFVAGGIAGAVLFKQYLVLRRVTYLLSVALLSLGLAISQFLYILLPEATDAGLFSVVMAAAMGSLIIFGVVNYITGAARSRHIIGDGSMAWMAFVPIANLWLIFSRGKNMEQETSRRPWSGRYLLDPALVIAALFMFSISQILTSTLENTAYFQPNDSAALTGLLSGAQTVEQSFAREAEGVAPQLPIRIDEVTVLTDVQATHETLSFTFDVESEITSFTDNFRGILAAEQCAANMFGPEISRGGLIELIYRGPDAQIIDTFRITQVDCDL